MYASLARADGAAEVVVFELLHLDHHATEVDIPGSGFDLDLCAKGGRHVHGDAAGAGVRLKGFDVGEETDVRVPAAGLEMDPRRAQVTDRDIAGPGLELDLVGGHAIGGHVPGPRFGTQRAAGETGQRHVPRAGVELEGAARIGDLHVPRAGAHGQRTFRARGGDVGRGHVHPQVAVDVGDGHAPDAEVYRDGAAHRHPDAQIGVRVHALAVAGHAHAAPVAPAPMAALVVAEGTVVADAQGRVGMVAEAPVDDVVLGIDHAEAVVAAHRAGRDLELVGVAAAALHVDGDGGAGRRFDADDPGNVVEGEMIAAEGVAAGRLRGAGRDRRDGEADAQERSAHVRISWGEGRVVPGTCGTGGGFRRGVRGWMAGPAEGLLAPVFRSPGRPDRMVLR